jgi:hypothetical protein
MHLDRGARWALLNVRSRFARSRDKPGTAL